MRRHAFSAAITWGPIGCCMVRRNDLRERRKTRVAQASDRSFGYMLDALFSDGLFRSGGLNQINDLWQVDGSYAHPLQISGRLL